MARVSDSHSRRTSPRSSSSSPSCARRSSAVRRQAFVRERLLTLSFARPSLASSEGPRRQARQEKPQGHSPRHRRRSERRQHDPSRARRCRYLGSRRTPGGAVGGRRDQPVQVPQEAAAGAWHLELPTAEQAHPVLVCGILILTPRWLTSFARSFYKNITLYMTGFWVCGLLRAHRSAANSATLAVLIPKLLLRPSPRGIMDPYLLQRPVHRPPACRPRSLRPVRRRTHVGSLPGAVHAWPAEQVCGCY